MKPSPADLPLQVIVLASPDRPDVFDVLQGSMHFRVDLGDVCDTRQLLDTIGAELMFPFAAAGMDALLDLMSDLDWFDHDGGYLLEFGGLDALEQSNAQLLATWAGLLPPLCDRWRSRGVPFRLVLRCQHRTRAALRDAIARANADLGRAGLPPWIVDEMPVAVIDCTD